MAPKLRIECAWCGSKIEQRITAGPGDDRVSHGVCVDCLGGLLELPVTDMHALTGDEVDRLPFGVMELTGMGVVKRYNGWEEKLARRSRENVIGKDFFREVAPCTRNTEFERTFRRLIREGGGDADFEFVFRFAHGHRLVRIRMLVEPEQDRHVVMVQDLEDERQSGEVDTASTGARSGTVRPRSAATAPRADVRRA